MKEIIDAVVVLGMLFGGTVILKNIHSEVRKATLEKASQGLPPLTGFTNQLKERKKLQPKGGSNSER